MAAASVARAVRIVSITPKGLPQMNAQIGMDVSERARRALTRVPPSVKISDEMVADVADAIRGAVRAAYQNAAVIATSRVHDGLPLDESRARRAEATDLAQQYDRLANDSR